MEVEYPDGSQEKLWTASEVVQVLNGLAHAYYAIPWPIRWLMRPWRDALVAANIAIAGENAYEDAIQDGLVNSLLEDYE